MALAALSLGFGPPSLVASDSGLLPIYRSQISALPGDPPGMVAKAALVMDLETGRIVYGSNLHERRAPASLTKIMTAIVVLENANLKDQVRIKREHMVWGSTMGLLPGDVVTVEDLLWGLLLPSGNDAALALADYVGGSVEAFVAKMNDKVIDLGLRNTHLKNPHGLDEEGHFSSAYDIAQMARYALRFPLFVQIVATPQTMRQAGRQFLLLNSNFLLRGPRQMAGVDGVKTGMTQDAGDAQVTTVTRDGHRVLTVVLGTNDRSYHSARLIEFAYREYLWVKLPPPPLVALSEAGGNGQQIMAASAPPQVLARWSLPYLRYSLRLTPPQNPSRTPERRGTITYWIGNAPLAEVPLLTAAR